MTEQIDSKWMKAAIVGGLWASVEIILGSFLHNLRIPLSGTILSANGVILMIAFDRHWGEKGMIWRAGLITALMKSISPSAVILGPMIGIISEAILLEIGVRLFGRNPLGYLVGGIAAISAVLLHKAVSLLILYGFNIVEVYINLFHFAIKQLHLPPTEPWIALLVLMGIYALIGLISALIGMRLSTGETNVKEGTQKFDSVRSLRTHPAQTEMRHSIPLAMLHLLMIPFVLLLFNYQGTGIPISIALIYTVFVFIRYPRGFRRVRKPIFWVQLLILTLLAGLFFEGLPQKGSILTMDGLMVGLEMSVRAIFIVAAFSGFSAELTNPTIKGWLVRNGFKQVYLSMEIAFAALPSIIDALPGARTVLLKPGATFRILFNKTDYLMDQVANKT